MFDLVSFLVKLKELIREGAEKEIEDGHWYSYAVCLDCLELFRYDIGINPPDHDLELMERIRRECEEYRSKHKGHAVILVSESFECETLCKYLLKKLEEVDSDGQADY